MLTHKFKKYKISEKKTILRYIIIKLEERGRLDLISSQRGQNCFLRSNKKTESRLLTEILEDRKQ